MRERVLMRFLLALLIVPALALLQAAPENRTLVVNGQPADVTIIQINGRAYADLEALARVVNGAVGFKGNEVTLTLLGSAASNQAQTPGSSPAANSEFSKEFVRAGIEEISNISNIRKWRSVLANAVQNGYLVTEAWMAGYRNQATTNLRLPSVAATTDSDRNAFQLLSNEFDNMQRLSNKFLAAHKSMTYVEPDSLKSDPLNQKVMSSPNPGVF